MLAQLEKIMDWDQEIFDNFCKDLEIKMTGLKASKPTQYQQICEAWLAAINEFKAQHVLTEVQIIRLNQLLAIFKTE
ncbi:MAG: hypothetical protein AB9856_14030 [Cellulosilyticaceae bacterium]